MGLVVQGIGGECAVEPPSSRTAFHPYIAVRHARDLLLALRTAGKELRQVVGRSVRSWVHLVNASGFCPVDASIGSEGGRLWRSVLYVVELAVAQAREAIGKGDDQRAVRVEKGARDGRHCADCFHVFCL